MGLTAYNLKDRVSGNEVAVERATYGASFCTGAVDGFTATAVLSTGYNAASVTDNGTGDYSVNFTNSKATSVGRSPVSTIIAGGLLYATYGGSLEAVTLIDLFTTDNAGASADRSISVDILGEAA